MKIYLLAATLFSCISVFGQTTTASSKVQQAISSKELNQLSAEDIAWKNFLADNMCIIQVNEKEASGQWPEISLGKASTEELTSENFNPFLYNITPLQSEHQYFRISGTDNTLFVYSLDRLQVLYYRYKINQK